jgi:FkbM family methyltransferase
MNRQDPVSQAIDLASRRRSFPRPPHRILIYGAGNRGREIRSLLESEGYQVAAFVDRSVLQETQIEGIPCYPFLARESIALARGGAATVVAIWRPDLDLFPILEEVARVGYDNPWSFYDICETFPGKLRDLYWVSPTSTIRESETAIRKAFSFLSDERSREIFLECLRLRAGGDLTSLRQPDVGSQYMPSDIAPLPPRLRMIDCGAFSGDTFSSLQQAGFSFDAYAAFEPDPRNYSLLVNRVRSKRCPPETILMPCGVWNKSVQLRFSSSGQDGSHIDPGGSTLIQTIDLDAALPSFRPNFIKMDIEGAEPEALDGGTRMILESKPHLAIALYHLPKHLWSIPIQILAAKPDYRLSIRYHGFAGFEVDLYASPQA